MSARPAKIESIIKVEIGRPRARDLPTLQLRAKILKTLDFAGKTEELSYYL